MYPILYHVYYAEACARSSIRTFPSQPATIDLHSEVGAVIISALAATERMATSAEAGCKVVYHFRETASQIAAQMLA